MRINQQFAPDNATFDGQAWESLGSYRFSSGKLSVSLSDDVTNGYVVADAIHIVEVPPVTVAPTVVDNGDAAYAEQGSGWLGWSETGAYQGDFRYHAPNAGKNGDLDFSGARPHSCYAVYATWSAQSNRATDSPYTICDDTMPLGTVRVNQQVAPSDATFNGQGWQSLGKYQLTSGKLTVSLSDDVSSGYVVADAIRVVKVNVPLVAGLSSVPDPAIQGEAVRLEANGVTDSSGTVASVAFYRDTSGNGVFDPTVDQCLGVATNGADGWAINASTAEFPPGVQYYFAQATDEQGITGNVATTMGLVEFAATLDNSQSGYSESGTGWTQASGSGDYLDTSRHHAAASGQDIANWQFSNLPSGEYNIYGTWSAASGQATNAPFTVYDGSSLAGTQRVDEQTAPTGVTADGQNWQLLGTYYIGSGQMTVQLSDDANGTVVADAIRIVDSGGGGGGGGTTLYWDPTHTLNQSTCGGSRLLGHDDTVVRYNPSTHSDVVWNNNSNYTATFANTAGSVAVEAPVVVASIHFACDGYSLGSDPLGSSALSVTVDNSGDTATISSPLTYTSGITKNGPGTLRLANNTGLANSAVTANAGTLQAGSDSSLCSGLTLGAGYDLGF